MTNAVLLAADRTLRVPRGATVRTGYVDVFRVRLDCRDRMAVGDVAEKYRELLQLGDGCRWPCPVGYWEGDTFHVTDGRHEWVAAVMLGREQILVAWVAS